MTKIKKILIILDGAADLPLDFLGEKTPFEIAETPNLDFFAKNGRLGYMYPINEKTIPGSDNALISIFGILVLVFVRFWIWKMMLAFSTISCCSLILKCNLLTHPTYYSQSHETSVEFVDCRLTFLKYVD